jgi:putative endopeptidase
MGASYQRLTLDELVTTQVGRSHGASCETCCRKKNIIFAPQFCYLMLKKIAVFSFCIGALASCSPVAQQNTKQDILVANRDTTVNPADDFFDYANGGWIKNNQIPADEARWGIGNLVQKELYEKLKRINEDALAKAEKTGSGQQIGDFWFSAMDSVSIEKNGIEPLREELKKIEDIKTLKDVLAQTAHMHTYGVNVFFDEGVSQDLKHSDIEAYYLTQGGLGMPIRNYYFDTDPRTTKVRAEYPKFIAQMFSLMGVDTNAAKAKADGIVKFETTLATSHKKLEELRDPEANYHKMAISELKKLAPQLDLQGIITQIGVHSVDSVIVGQPAFYKALDKVLTTANLQIVKDYMTFHLVQHFASYLSTPFSKANFDFYGKSISGAEQQHPRWRRALDVEEGIIGESLGKLFVQAYFKPEAKKRYENIVENVRNAYKARMEKLDWMSDSTKKKAIAKLMSIKKKVGYPEKWKDLSTLKIDRGAYALNVMRAGMWWNNYYLNKLGKPVDRNEWDMTPQTYNAYYNPSNNEIVLPAAQMTVPGFADEELDDALVYGYTAASTIGHEITHGFDDEGRKYDGNGNLSSWWTPADSTQFEQRAKLLVEQFNKMVPLDTMHINGRATLGENLADLGGLLIGLDAFKNTEVYKKGEKIQGQTPLQRFFLGYTLGWLLQERPERLANQLLTDVHAPAKNRVNGPFPNISEFYQAFNVKPENKLYLPDSLRVHLW